jgi:hypothetical protein
MIVWYSNSPSSDVVDLKIVVTEEVYDCCVHGVCVCVCVCVTGYVRKEEADGV